MLLVGTRTRGDEPVDEDECENKDVPLEHQAPSRSQRRNDNPTRNNDTPSRAIAMRARSARAPFAAKATASRAVAAGGGAKSANIREQSQHSPLR